MALLELTDVTRAVRLPDDSMLHILTGVDLTTWADGEPISVSVTVSDLMDKAMRTCPSDVRDQVLQPEDEDAECSGRFYLPLTGQL